MKGGVNGYFSNSLTKIANLKSFLLNLNNSLPLSYVGILMKNLQDASKIINVPSELNYHVR